LCSEEPATGLYAEPDEPGLHCLILFLKNNFKYPPIYAPLTQVVSFVEVKGKVALVHAVKAYGGVEV
jgi:hypothetical protein